MRHEKRFTEVLAGDCHVLAVTASSEVFAWGQGVIVEKNGTQQDVICNNPVSILGGIENEMLFELDDKEVKLDFKHDDQIPPLRLTDILAASENDDL